ncbi:MAG: cupin domain-containing protein [Gammaproteobacteria bacterium]
MCGTGVKIERIVSKGQRSEPGFWYDQEQNEWVVLIRGEAELRFEDGNRSVRLTAGMHVNIPAHTRHRVEWTKQDEVTIWLAVFYQNLPQNAP